MILIIITSIVLVGAVIGSIIAFQCDWDGFYIIFCVVMSLASLFLIVELFVWGEAGYKAEFYNEKYGTNYTQEQMFWIGSLIERQQTEIKDKKIYLEVE
jgi:hypothetical protein